MKLCANCNNCFRNNFDLNRHLSRKKPCDKKIFNTTEKPSPQTVIESPQMVIESPQTVIESPQTVIESPQTVISQDKPVKIVGIVDKLNCKWCLKQFSRTAKLTAHVCRLKDDPIRKLEMEIGITPCMDTDCCRFCKKQFKHIKRHQCNQKDTYQENLKRKNIDASCNIINNNINNTIINNIINIELVGHEIIENINLNEVQNCIVKCKNQPNKVNTIKACDMVVSFGQIIRKNPANCNIIIPNAKSLTAQIKTLLGWETISTEEAIDISFKNTAKKLIQLRPKINVIENEIIILFKDIDGLAKDGMEYGSGCKGIRSVKSRYKVNLMNKNSDHRSL
jgi:hypothetical protein